LCKIRYLAQPEADIDVVNKLFVERVKTLTNQQKVSDEKLTSFEKERRASVTDYEFHRAIIKAESETTIMSDNE